MSETLPAVRPPANGALVASSLSEYMELARALAASGRFGSPADVLVKVLAGRELGFGAVASLMDISISEQGRLIVGAHLRAAAIRASGRYDFRVREHSDAACAVEFLRLAGPGQWETLGIERLTFAEAEAKGWTMTRGGKRKDPWYGSPKNMLYARCLTNGYRFHCPDLSGGVNLFDADEFDSAGPAIDADFTTAPPAEAPAEGPAPNGQAPAAAEAMPGTIGEGLQYQELVALVRTHKRSAMDVRALCAALGVKTLSQLTPADLPRARALIEEGQATALQVDRISKLMTQLNVPTDAQVTRLREKFRVSSYAHLTAPEAAGIIQAAESRTKAPASPQVAGASPS